MRKESDLQGTPLREATEALDLAIAPWLRPELPLHGRLRRKAGAALVDGFFAGASHAFRSIPLAHPRLHRVEVQKDIAYRGTSLAEHRLDVYKPLNTRGKVPVVLYVHGGAFRALSKDTHWIFGLWFARRGYLVFNISYRLAPKHPFPAALADTCAAYEWVVHNAERFGGDVSKLILAGESAGANLVTSTTIAACYERPEPWAEAVWRTGVVPKATIPACGILQVTNPERFSREKPINWFLRDRLHEIGDHYFHGYRQRPPTHSIELADPLLVLERGAPPQRPLPAFHACAGTWDPLLDDTRRLKTALDRLGVRCEARYYEREPHAFHAFVFRPNGRRYWRDVFTFLDDVVRRP